MIPYHHLLSSSHVIIPYHIVVPNHDVWDIHEHVWAKVDELTKYDAILYQHAILRFLREFENLVTTKYNSSLTICSFKNSHIELILLAVSDEFPDAAYMKTTLKSCLKE